jgi:hypothetical protein
MTAHDTLSRPMSEPESVAQRRWSWPADYYSGPSPRAVLPRGVTFGCGAASVVAMILIFAGGAFMSSGGMFQFMDLALGMTMSEVRGMYDQDVTPAQKKELEDSVEALRKNLREEKVSIANLDPVLKAIRKSSSDKKLQPAEVTAISAAARKANAAKQAAPKDRPGLQAR